MKYSLRSLMIVVTLVCVVFGVTLGYVRHERERIHHKWEVTRALYSRGAELGGNYPKPFEEMYTWRGCETVEYTELLTIGRSASLEADDFRKLVSTFPTIRDVFVCDYELTGEQLRLLGKFPRLEKLRLVRSPADEDDIRWLKSQYPEMQLEIIHSTP
jgi:hypothetical protein